MITTQFDIFGATHTVAPGGRATLAEYTDYCNLCLIDFATNELPPMTRHVWHGHHICERCQDVINLAEQDKANGIRRERWRDVEFYTRAADGAIIIALDDRVHFARGHNVQRGTPIGRLFGFALLDDLEARQAATQAAYDAGILTDADMLYTDYRIDAITEELHDNIGYNRIGDVSFFLSSVSQL